MSTSPSDRPCRTCGEVKPESAFALDKRRGKRDVTCRQCIYTARRVRHLERWGDPEYRAWMRTRNKESAANHRRQIRTVTDAAKAKPCADCGVSYPGPVMEFDHVRGTKRFTIAHAGSGQGKAYSTLAALQDEIAKCDVVCANCHRLRHHHERNAEAA